jgi:hypothetical protein
MSLPEMLGEGTTIAEQYYSTANLVPVMKTGIPCAHILTGKTWFYYRKNLLSIQVVSWSNLREPVFKAPYNLFYPLCGVQGCGEEQMTTMRLNLNLDSF